MDEELIERLNTTGANLQARASQLAQSQDRDTALLMHGLAVAIEAIGSLASTADRLDGLKGLGGTGSPTLPSD